MWTDRYCPECGLKLAETRDEHGEVMHGKVACRNDHWWSWFVDDSTEQFRRPRESREKK